MSATTTQIVTLRLRSGAEVRAVFKVEDYSAGVRVLREATGGPLYVREIAASRLSDELGFHLVPPTTKLTIDGQTGSAQLFVDGSDPLQSAYFWDAPNQPSPVSPAKRELVQIFDRIIGNGDRHAGNWFVHDGSPVAIDNGFSFPVDLKDERVKRWTQLQMVRRVPMPARIEPATKELLQKASPQQAARILVESGLEDKAVEGAVKRLEALREHFTVSRPTTDEQIERWVKAAHHVSLHAVIPQ